MTYQTARWNSSKYFRSQWGCGRLDKWTQGCIHPNAWSWVKSKSRQSHRSANLTGHTVISKLCDSPFPRRGFSLHVNSNSFWIAAIWWNCSPKKVSVHSPWNAAICSGGSPCKHTNLYTQLKWYNPEQLKWYMLKASKGPVKPSCLTRNVKYSKCTPYYEPEMGT